MKTGRRRVMATATVAGLVVCLLLVSALASARATGHDPPASAEKGMHIRPVSSSSSSQSTSAGFLSGSWPVYAEEEISVHPYPVQAGVPTEVCVQLYNPTPTSQEVEVQFSWSEFGIGLAFTPIDGPQYVLVPALGEVTECIFWVPPLDGQVCLQVDLSVPGHDTVWSQRNMDVDEPLAPGTPHVRAFAVRNPLDHEVTITLGLVPHLPDWGLELSQDVLPSMGSGEVREVLLTVTPPGDLPADEQPVVDVEAFAEGDLIGGFRKMYRPLGDLITIWEDSVSNVSPAVAYNTLHDEYLVVWHNFRPVTTDIYARRVGSDGTVKSSFTVVTGEGETYNYPAVAYSPVQDQYLIVYVHQSSTADYDIKARRVTWDGGLISEEFVIRDDVDKQWLPAVAYNSADDEYLVVYNNSWVGGLDDIAAQRVKASDGALLSWRNIATGAGGDGNSRFFPDVAYNESRNEYLIAYSYEYSPTDWDIYARVASANLGTLSSELHIVADTDFQDSVALAAGPDEYLAVWDDGPSYVVSPVYRTIRARRVTGAGALQPSMVIVDESAEVHQRPDVAYGGVWGYSLTWEFEVSYADNDVLGRWVRPGQNQPTGGYYPIDTRAAQQEQPALACDPSADCLVAYMDGWNPGTEIDYEIRGRIVGPWHVYVPLALRNAP